MDKDGIFITIREIIPADRDLENVIEQICSIWIDAQETTMFPLIKEMNPQLWNSLISDSEVLSMERLKRAYACTIRNHFKLIVACEKEKVLGYVLLIPLNYSDEAIQFLDQVSTGQSDDLIPSDKEQLKKYLSTSNLYIEEFMIHSSVQRKGVGSLLMNYILHYGHCHGYTQYIVTTLAQNEKACSFYKKFGFVQYKNYLDKNGLSTVVLKKTVR